MLHNLRWETEVHWSQNKVVKHNRYAQAMAEITFVLNIQKPYLKYE